MPGYNLCSSDQEKVEEKYTCSFCHLLLKDAVQTCCGHLYCKECLGHLYSNNQNKMTCVVCQEKFLENEVFSDTSKRQEVQSRVVHCTSMDDGCMWEGKIRELEDHLGQCECHLRTLIYGAADQSKPGAQKSKHHVVNCSSTNKDNLRENGSRQVVSQGLGIRNDTPITERDEMRNQRRIDDQGMESIPIWDEQTRRMDSTASTVSPLKLTHDQNPILGDCERTEGRCPFSQIGCSKTEVLSQKEKKKHLSEENIHHNVLLLRFAVRVSKEMESVLRSDPRILSSRQQMFMNYDNVIQDLLNQIQIHSDTERHLQEMLQQHSERITAVERKLVLVNTSGGSSGASSQCLPDDEGSSVSANVERRVTDLGNKTADHEVLILENNRIAMESSREAANLRRRLDNVQESSRRLEQRMESTEHALALRYVTLADLEEYVKKQEFFSYDGQLTWKITEHARRRSEAVNGQKVSFYSPCFYTSRYGYKMCARIYLNGDGMGRGTHISLFFVVMRGEYDAILPWPFRQKVTFMLLDQDNVEHVIEAFRPDPNSSSFQRPRGEANIPSGCPMFCSNEELSKRAYVRDDTMFFKIIVDVSDL
ncbi:TNF receptor-associated factor 2-like [Acropora palmata]|uniref:TNF receptor-associated factor 2-like n=1 Tax=Acropora palmata TaxID=6131 RepID=UPI003DA0778D